MRRLADLVRCQDDLAAVHEGGVPNAVGLDFKRFVRVTETASPIDREPARFVLNEIETIVLA